MVIEYSFVLGGETFECKTFDDLTHLDTYHDIVWIDCSQNNLTVLPTLPNSLTHLCCHNNKLTLLPTLPNSLIHLNCAQNRLTVLPILPNSLIDLMCYDNLLNIIPVLPKSLSIYYYNNPVNTYIRDKCDNNLEIYHRINEIFALKLVRWYLDCRENPIFKFCRDRINKEYDVLMEEDINGGIMG